MAFLLSLFTFSKRRYLALSVAVLCFFAASTSLIAQVPEEIVRTETSLVQLNVGVVDRQGRAITSLSPNDFAVYEDGVRRPIVHFEPTNAPFSLVLLLDMSGSTLSFRQQIGQAALRFLDALGAEDRVSVIQFNGKGTKSLVGFSNNYQDIVYAIQLAGGKGETHFYDALKYALKELGKEGKRRKAIVVLTDGVDTKLRKADGEAAATKPETNEAAIGAIKPDASPQLTSVLNDADRQGVTIFPLALPSGDAKHLPFPNPIQIAIYTAARTRLQTLANRTGGRLNEIRSLDQMARLYAEVAADLRSLYSIAYQPPAERLHDGRWREIRIDVTHAELIARTKPGYFAR